MPQAATERFGLVAPSANDALVEGDDRLRAMAARLEVLQTGYLIGVAPARPAVSAANRGFAYLATDTGRVSLSTGTAWIDLPNADDMQAAADAVAALPPDVGLQGAVAGTVAVNGLTSANQPYIVAGTGFQVSAEPQFLSQIRIVPLGTSAPYGWRLVRSLFVPPPATTIPSGQLFSGNSTPFLFDTWLSSTPTYQGPWGFSFVAIPGPQGGDVVITGYNG